MNVVQSRRPCRLVLIAPAADGAGARLAEALCGGDVASVILARDGLGETRYRSHCAELVAIAQKANAAALVCDNMAVAEATGADGVFFSAPPADLKEIVARHSPARIVGCGGLDDRHDAMLAAEAGPDFVFFGRPDGDTRPQPHPKSLELAEWWSQLAEIPCIVMAGSNIAAIGPCARTGAEFVAAGLAVFSATGGPGAAVESANRIIDEHAPQTS